MDRKDEDDLALCLKELMEKNAIELSLPVSRDVVRALSGRLRSMNCSGPLISSTSLDSVQQLSEVADEIAPFLYALAERFGDGDLWGEHSRLTRRYWKYAVANSETNHGYWFWLLGQLAAEEQ